MTVAWLPDFRWLLFFTALSFWGCSSSSGEVVQDAKIDGSVDADTALPDTSPDRLPPDTSLPDASLPFRREGRSWALHAINTIGGAPIFPTVALGPDALPVVAYRKGTPKEHYPVVSRWDGSNWSAPETIERQTDTFLGKSPSVAVDKAGGVHVAYYNEDAKRWRYARRASAGAAWELSYPYEEPDADAGDNSVLRIDSAGRLHATFVRYKLYHTIYALLDPTKSTWQFSPLSGAGAPVKAYEATLAVSAQGQAHVVYSDDTDNLYYARGGLDGWTVEPVDTTTPDIGHYLDSALDTAGQPHIIHLQWTKKHPSVWVARRRNDKWEAEQVDTELGIAYAAAIAVLVDNTEIIAYVRNLGEGAEDGLWFGYRREGDAEWTLELVDGSSYVSGVDLVAAADGTLYLIYFDETSYILRSAILAP